MTHRTAWQVLGVDRERLFAGGAAMPRYEAITAAFEEAIAHGRLRMGERLPPVRQVASDLGVSVATIMAAYEQLTQHGVARGEVGRGTYVMGLPARNSSGPPGPGRTSRSMGSRLARPATIPWRRRALAASAARLRAAYPEATDCTSGRPDPTLLPLDLLARAWRAALNATTHADLQYAGPEPLDALIRQLLPRLEADSIPARDNDLIVGSSAQQMLVLSLQVAQVLSDKPEMIVAVEEPGYPAALDTFERAGYRLLGFEVDEQGAIPASLDAALAGGASAVLLTPRAHNPVGASWTLGRMAELTSVLAAHSGVIAIEDDQFAGIATTRPGSLLADSRVADRVVYIRSFSKSIAPDLRVAVAVARPRLRALITEAKSFADGWTSRLTQRALAHILADSALDMALEAACRDYAARRAAAARAVAAGSACNVWEGRDGVNIWIHLPPETDATDVIERAAALGVLVAPGDPFFIRPGRRDVVRLNAGAVNAGRAAEVGRALASAAAMATPTGPTTVSV